MLGSLVTPPNVEESIFLPFCLLSSYVPGVSAPGQESMCVELRLNQQSSYSIQANPTMGCLLLIKNGHALLLRGRAER